jgi:flagellar assembly protein FliH
MPRARVVPAARAARAVPVLAAGPSEPQRRRIAREELGALLEAERIVEDARERADLLLASARAEAQGTAAAAAREAREEARAELAERWLALRAGEQRRIESDADRIVPVAVALAERLLGVSLGLEPERIVYLARAVIDEARGARRAAIDAHPLDAEALRRQLTDAGLDAVRTVEVRDDAALARGELRLHTDVGTIDARLAPRFERLAAALRDVLK